MTSQVQIVQQALDEYIQYKQQYLKESKEFVSEMRQTISNFKSADNTIETNETDVAGYYKDIDSNAYYVLTKEKVLMKLNGSGTFVPEIYTTGSYGLNKKSPNSIIMFNGEKVFYSDDTPNSEPTYFNTVVQSMYPLPDSNYIPEYEYSQKTTSITGLEPVVSTEGATECKLYDVNRCDAIANGLNKEYYSLNIGDKGCECYVLNSTELSSDSGTLVDPDNENIISIPISLLTNTGDKSVGNDVGYLGIMFDGGLYSLQDDKYSNNFKGIYNPDETKLSLLSPTSSIISGCNPFTGPGIHNVTINDLGVSNLCTPKTETSQDTTA